MNRREYRRRPGMTAIRLAVEAIFSMDGSAAAAVALPVASCTPAQELASR